MHPNIENIIFSLFWVKTQKLKKIVTNTFYFVIKSGEIKSRSPFHAITDLSSLQYKPLTTLQLFTAVIYTGAAERDEPADTTRLPHHTDHG